MSTRVVSLNREQRRYVAEASFLSDLSRHRIPTEIPERWVMEDHVAEQFRDEFTQRLAVAGFRDEELSKEGAILEDLIDAFFPEDVR